MTDDRERLNYLAREILDAAMTVHKELGPGLPESVETVLPVHEAQLISYLKLSNKRLGFLINFISALPKQGFKRFVNEFLDSEKLRVLCAFAPLR